MKRKLLPEKHDEYFGPGMDLIISLFAVFLILFVIGAKFYRNVLIEKNKLEEGKFKLASVYFNAGHFEVFPVNRLSNPSVTDSLINILIEEYNINKQLYPYIFIIGHANEIDDPNAEDKSYKAKVQRNWIYASRRAALIGGLLQEHLSYSDKNKMIIVSTGEYDLAKVNMPYSQINAFVEVVFAKEWKPPSSNYNQL